jgi:hypothetical protein
MRFKRLPVGFYEFGHKYHYVLEFSDNRANKIANLICKFLNKFNIKLDGRHIALTTSWLGNRRKLYYLYIVREGRHTGKWSVNALHREK